MRNRNLIAVLAGVFLLAILGLTVYLQSRPEVTVSPEAVAYDSALVSNRYEEARVSPTNGVKCLEENTALIIEPSERTRIEYTSMAHVYDVPAGTHVDIRIASYSEDKVTGSNLYESDYGTYNFELSKQDENWAVTAYNRCEI